MIIDCISDLHGDYPILKGGDLLIVAGDLTGKDGIAEYYDFICWLMDSKAAYKKKVVIAGNHDVRIQNEDWKNDCRNFTFTYLEDSGINFDGLNIWGSPWTWAFPGINPGCTAFTVANEDDLKAKWDLIPENTDILVTHCPPFGYGDYVSRSGRTGSTSLTRRVAHLPRLKLHVFGHIHEGYGVWDFRILKEMPGGTAGPIFVNAAHMDRNYDPKNKPLRIEL